MVLGVMISSASEADAQSATDQMLAQSGDAYIAYNAKTQTFEIGTRGISRRMDYEPGSGFRLVSLKNKLTGREWLAPGGGASAELRLGLDGQVITGSAKEFQLRGYVTVRRPDGSLELEIILVRGQLIAHLHYLAFPETSIFEQWIEITNSGTSQLHDLTALDSIFFALRPSREELVLYWVQGLNPEVPEQSQPYQVPILRVRSVRLTDGTAQELGSSARSSEGSMGWFALASPSLREGIFGGIEWSGAWQLRAARANGQTLVQGGLQGIRNDLGPGETFESPRRFLGFYSGNLDGAANASHDFARKYLLRARPENFPWTQYNTWFAYYTTLDEETLKREVDNAAEMGLEAFYIDAGWYEGSPADADFSWGLGTWRENRDKFPGGLAAFADYVHSKGLKFGLWVEPERVDLRYVGPALEISEKWLAPGTPFGVVPPEGLPQTAQICLGNEDARTWMKDWLARIVREYHVDWLKWDNNVWMSCDPPGEVGMGNYLHVRGLYNVLDWLRAEFPDLIIENCASGGNRMDFGLMRRTDIAWLSDQTDPSYRVRYHVFGASYPFPPAYLNSWLVESFWEQLSDGEQDQAVLRSWLRSRMMGAFGISVSTVGWDEELRSAISAQVAQYKSIREIIANGRHYHLLPQTDLSEPQLEPPTEPDAAEFYDPASDRAVVFLFKGQVAWSDRRVVLRGLSPDHLYQVNSADGTISLQRTGRQLMTQNISLPYATEHPSALLFVTPVTIHTQ